MGCDGGNEQEARFSETLLGVASEDCASSKVGVPTQGTPPPSKCSEGVGLSFGLHTGMDKWTFDTIAQLHPNYLEVVWENSGSYF